MKTVKTMCARDCYDSCFLTAEVGDDGILRKVDGDPTSPVTQGFLCPRGQKDVARVYENRVRIPHIRTQDKPGKSFRSAGWNEALDRVAAKLKETIDRFGRDKVLMMDYSGNTGLLSEEFPHRLWNALGAARTDGAMCSATGRVALSLHYGEPYGLLPEELGDKDLIVFWGFNAPVSSAHLWALALKAKKNRGATIVAIDPRQSEVAKLADNHLQPKPFSDTALAFGICRILIETRQIDDAFIEAETSGFDRLTDAVMAWTPAQVETETGLSWKDVEVIARLYAETRQSATMIGIGLQKAINGADMARAIALIPALRGQHRGFFYSNSSAFGYDKSDINGNAHLALPVKTISQVAAADRIRNGEFKFIFVYGMNPALTLPYQTALREGLSRSDTFLVVHDTHWTETAHYADVVLPAQTFFEKTDMVASWVHPHLRYCPKVIEPVGESQNEVWVMQELGRRLGVNDSRVFEDPWIALEKAFDGAFENGTFADYLEGKSMVLRRKPVNTYPTPSGKLEFYSTSAEKSGWDPLPVHRRVSIEPNRFFLLNSATRHYTSTQFTEQYGPIPAVVTVNAKDAARLNLKHGERVQLQNTWGQVEVAVEVSDAVLPGTLWMPRQSIGHDGRPMNELISPETQTIGNGPTFNSTWVEIKTLD
ncbi:MAG: molybdopterin-dependent oxidoreductase [Candidatus Omnitrophota bacterium]